MCYSILNPALLFHKENKVKNKNKIEKDFKEFINVLKGS